MTHALSAVPPTSAPKAHQKAQTSDLHSHGDGASPARQAGAEGTPVTGMEACECTRGEVGSVSWLELRSRLDVTGAPLFYFFTSLFFNFAFFFWNFARALTSPFNLG